MPNDDTIKLLNECNSGIKMGVQGINEVMDNAEDKQLIDILNKYLKEHERLGNKTHEYLNKFHDTGKEPSTIATAMSWVKINFKMMQGNQDEQIADVMTDGCNMGIKSIAKSFLLQHVQDSFELHHVIHYYNFQTLPLLL